jgi:hypothetical protein
MEIPKEAILHFLQERGQPEKAAQADRDLPEQVDTDRDAGLLSRLGIDAEELVGMADQIPGLRDKLGGIL